MLMQEKYPEGIALETVFVHTSLVSVLDAAAEEALNGGGWYASSQSHVLGNDVVFLRYLEQVKHGRAVWTEMANSTLEWTQRFLQF